MLKGNGRSAGDAFPDECLVPFSKILHTTVASTSGAVSLSSKMMKSSALAAGIGQNPGQGEHSGNESQTGRHGTKACNGGSASSVSSSHGTFCLERKAAKHTQPEKVLLYP
ncbi:hypothetical protein HMPREF3038_02122 [Akkermansia sp. KLE1797]|nr:hypothetical protein HMPREF3038_02122 [Akkermansia sp. KLE1797]